MQQSPKCVVVRNEYLREMLSGKPVQGKRLLEPLKALSLAEGLPFNVLEDADVVNLAELHKHEADLWLCLEGEVTFVYGGEMVDPWPTRRPDGTVDEGELKAKEIRNGTEAVLKSGDWLYIPAGAPHQHKCAGVARLVIIKIPAKA